MTGFPSRNTKISLIGLIILGMLAVFAIAYNIDKWFAGGAAVKKVVQACDVLGTGCSGAVSSIFQTIGSPQQLLLSLAWAALALALIRAAVIVVSAHRVASGFKHTDEFSPRVKETLNDLGFADIQVRIADSNEVSAFTYGVLKPTVCLTSGLIESLSDEELSSLLAHEVGHISRRDNLAIFIALFIRDFLWPLPVSHHLFSVFIHEKEYAADDFAVQLTGNPLELASAIVSVAKAAKTKKELSPAYATFFSNKATAKERVNRLLGSSKSGARPSLFKLLTSILLSALIAVCIVGVAYAQPLGKASDFGKCKMGRDCTKVDYSCCRQDKSTIYLGRD